MGRVDSFPFWPQRTHSHFYVFLFLSKRFIPVFFLFLALFFDVIFDLSQVLLVFLMFYNMNHLQKNWSDPKDSRVQGFKGSSEIL